MNEYETGSQVCFVRFEANSLRQNEKEKWTITTRMLMIWHNIHYKLILYFIFQSQSGLDQFGARIFELKKSFKNQTPFQGQIYHWLWNIPTLKSCDLTMELPKSSDFHNGSQQLLASDMVYKAIERQCGFKELKITLQVGETRFYLPFEVNYIHCHDDPDWKVRG